jgi:hypothetical protein
MKTRDKQSQASDRRHWEEKTRERLLWMVFTPGFHELSIRGTVKG